MSGPEVSDLDGLFPDAADLGGAERVPASELPEPYRALLDHPHHMTVTVEAHYGQPVEVEVLACRRDGDDYARKILLRLRDGSRVVQSGIVRIRLSECAPPVAAAILEGKTPLGRVLIEHDVLRSIHPTGFVRLETPPSLAAWFGLSAPATVYGRLGVILCDGRPAIEVLEILAPV